MHPSHILFVLATLASPLEAPAQSNYTNPIDGKTYTTPGEFRTYNPTNPKDQSKHRVKNEGITLLTGEPDVKARTSVEELARFLQEAEARTSKALDKNVGAAAVLVQFNCKPGQCTVQLAHDGKAQKSVLQGLYDSLSAMKPLQVSDEVIFQVTFKVDA